MKMVSNKGRNVVNMDEIERFVSWLTAKVDREDVRRWLTSGFRSYLIHNYPWVKECDPLPAGSLDKEYSGLASGRKAYSVLLDDDIKLEAQQILDYLCNGHEGDLSALSVSEVISRTRLWSLRRQRKASDTEDLQGIKPVLEYPTGYKWVTVISPASLFRENKLMEHGIASSYGKGLIDVYSLRDDQNQPQVTIEVNKNYNSIVQIKGRGNSRILREFSFREHIFDFINFSMFAVNNHDVEGMLQFNGKYYDAFYFAERLKGSDYSVLASVLTNLEVCQSDWYQRLVGEVGVNTSDLRKVLPKDRIGAIITGEDYIECANYDFMLKNVLGISYADFKTYLSDEELANLANNKCFWRKFACTHSEAELTLLFKQGMVNRNYHVISSKLDLLGLSGEDILRISVQYPGVLSLYSLDEAPVGIFRDRSKLVSFLRSKLTEPCTTSALRSFLYDRLELSMEETAGVINEVPGVLPLLEPDPEYVPEKFFVLPNRMSALVTYFNNVFKNFASQSEIERMSGILLMRLNLTDGEISLLQQGLEKDIKQCVRFGRNYENLLDAEADLNALGISRHAGVVAAFLSQGLADVSLKAIYAAITRELPPQVKAALALYVYFVMAGEGMAAVEPGDVVKIADCIDNQTLARWLKIYLILNNVRNRMLNGDCRTVPEGLPDDITWEDLNKNYASLDEAKDDLLRLGISVHSMALQLFLEKGLEEKTLKFIYDNILPENPELISGALTLYVYYVISNKAERSNFSRGVITDLVSGINTATLSRWVRIYLILQSIRVGFENQD